MKSVELLPGDPIDNLAIGTIIEVDGTRIVAEIDSEIAELSRVYAGMVYPIGQFGSIIRIHYGRNILYAYVNRLRMKAEYQLERGLPANFDPSDRVIEADLFGEGEWKHIGENVDKEWRLDFERGVSTFPLPQQRIYLTPVSELRYIFGQGIAAPIEIGEHVGSGGSPAFADLNELL